MGRAGKTGFGGISKTGFGDSEKNGFTYIPPFTGVASSDKQRGKRPYFYKEKNVGRVGVDLCATMYS